VSVAGQFNNWNGSALCKETPGGVWNGNWSLDVAGATTGQQYQYKVTANSTTANFRDPYARLVNQAQQFGGNSITYDPKSYVWAYKSPTTTPALSTLVIYEMHVGTFDATANSPGTFSSAAQQLSYLKGLGFNAIELIPISQFDGVRTNPYNPTDPFSVNNDEYGGPDALKAFIDAAHSLGMVIILDVVHSFWNATGDSSVYNWQNSVSTSGSTYYPDGKYFYDCSTSISQQYPCSELYGGFGSRPNYSNTGGMPVGGANGYIAQEMSMWVNEYHVDGFRWDSIGNIYNSCNGGVGTCQGASGISLPDGVSLIQAINGTQSNLFKFAEDLTGGSSQQYDTQAIPNPVNGSPNLGFDSQWNGTMAYFFDRDMPGTGQFPIADLEQILNPYYFWNGIGLHDTNYVQSHNELQSPNSRLIELIDNNTSGNPPSLNALKKTSLAAGILFTTPGVPIVYQGDEFLDYSTFDFTTPLNWQNETTYSGWITMYQHLIAARENQNGNTAGLTDASVNAYHEDSTSDVVAWDRYNSSSPCTNDVVVVANLNSTNMGSTYRIGLPCSGTWKVVFNSDSTTYNPGFGAIGPSEGSTLTAQSLAWDGMNYSINFAIGKFSLIILARN
jgi:1,4-alpha-glucan branching enzyme